MVKTGTNGLVCSDSSNDFSNNNKTRNRTAKWKHINITERRFILSNHFFKVYGVSYWYCDEFDSSFMKYVRIILNAIKDRKLLAICKPYSFQGWDYVIWISEFCFSSFIKIIPGLYLVYNTNTDLLNFPWESISHPSANSNFYIRSINIIHLTMFNIISYRK